MNTVEQMIVASEPETVSADAQCPICHQNIMDLLEWQDDFETVQCQSCGERYTL